mmetsp:Transcript_84636/g.192944  ORF Transcript_84636/g.192944 Transcript_84636/m.192944 type:complete len:107 (+) Transcript_84636:175-495(+)
MKETIIILISFFYVVHKPALKTTAFVIIHITTTTWVYSIISNHAFIFYTTGGVVNHSSLFRFQRYFCTFSFCLIPMTCFTVCSPLLVIWNPSPFVCPMILDRVPVA